VLIFILKNKLGHLLDIINISKWNDKRYLINMAINIEQRWFIALVKKIAGKNQPVIRHLEKS